DYYCAIGHSSGHGFF
nr:immunoglobulin light chain junction region [Macaca mulatta]